jgi:aspartyl aminopeptidase
MSNGISDLDVLAALHPAYANVVQSTNSATLAAGDGLQALAKAIAGSNKALPSAVSQYAPVVGPSPATMHHIYIQGWKG